MNESVKFERIYKKRAGCIDRPFFVGYSETQAD